MEDDHEGSQDPHRIVAPVEKNFWFSSLLLRYCVIVPACWKNYIQQKVANKL
jgi:hypothetical protein